MDSMIEISQNTFEWQQSMLLPGILPDPPGVSPAQSTDDGLHTPQSSSGATWGDGASAIIDPKELGRFDSRPRLQRQAHHGAESSSETPPSDGPNRFEPRRKKRLAEWSDTESQDQAQQTELRRQRNRVAASKCRRKSKEKNDIMLECERQLEQQHDALKSCVENLRDEVLNLREELLRHADCNCEPIQNHIAKSIRAVMAQPIKTAPWKVANASIGESG